MDELNLYDDLDEFQEQQDKKSKELLGVEEKYQQSLKTIANLEIENKSLTKKIQRIELSFQSLLDTARAELKRKDKEIERLRKEKDDICFRRRRIPHQRINDTEMQQFTDKSALQQQFVKNPFRSDTAPETVIAVSTSDKTEKDHDHFAATTDKTLQTEDSKKHFTDSHKRNRSRDDDRQDLSKKHKHNNDCDGNHQTMSKPYKNDCDTRNKGRLSESERCHKELSNRRDLSRNRLIRDHSPNRKNHDKKFEKASQSTERYRNRFDRAHSRDGNRRQSDHSRESKKSSKSSESPERNSKRLERGRSHNRQSSDHAQKGWARHESRDRKINNKNSTKSSKSPERNSHKHSKDRSHHDDNGKKNSENSQRSLNQNLGCKDITKLTEINADKKEISQKTIDELQSFKENNDVMLKNMVKSKEGNNNIGKSKNKEAFCEQALEVIADNAKESLNECDITKSFKQQKLFEISTAKLTTEPRDGLAEKSTISCNNNSVSVNYSLDLTKTDEFEDKQLLKRNHGKLEKQKSADRNLMTSQKQLSTPRKLALYESLFGPSPSNNSSSSNATTSCSSSKSLLTNIMGILASTTNIVVSDATTSSQAESLKANSPSQTLSKNEEITYDANEFDKCFTKNDDSITNEMIMIKSIDLTDDHDNIDVNDIEIVQIPGLDLKADKSAVKLLENECKEDMSLKETPINHNDSFIIPGLDLLSTANERPSIDYDGININIESIATNRFNNIEISVTDVTSQGPSVMESNHLETSSELNSMEWNLLEVDKDKSTSIQRNKDEDTTARTTFVLQTNEFDNFSASMGIKSNILIADDKRESLPTNRFNNIELSVTDITSKSSTVIESNDLETSSELNSMESNLLEVDKDKSTTIQTNKDEDTTARTTFVLETNELDNFSASKGIKSTILPGLEFNLSPPIEILNKIHIDKETLKNDMITIDNIKETEKETLKTLRIVESDKKNVHTTQIIAAENSNVTENIEEQVSIQIVDPVKQKTNKTVNKRIEDLQDSMSDSISFEKLEDGMVENLEFHTTEITADNKMEDLRVSLPDSKFTAQLTIQDARDQNLDSHTIETETADDISGNVSNKINKTANRQLEALHVAVQDSKLTEKLTIQDIRDLNLDSHTIETQSADDISGTVSNKTNKTANRQLEIIPVSLQDSKLTEKLTNPDIRDLNLDSHTIETADDFTGTDKSKLIDRQVSLPDAKLTETFTVKDVRDLNLNSYTTDDVTGSLNTTNRKLEPQTESLTDTLSTSPKATDIGKQNLETHITETIADDKFTLTTNTSKTPLPDNESFCNKNVENNINLTCFITKEDKPEEKIHEFHRDETKTDDDENNMITQNHSTDVLKENSIENKVAMKIANIKKDKSKRTLNKLEENIQKFHGEEPITAHEINTDVLEVNDIATTSLINKDDKSLKNLNKIEENIYEYHGEATKHDDEINRLSENHSTDFLEGNQIGNKNYLANSYASKDKKSHEGETKTAVAENHNNVNKSTSVVSENEVAINSSSTEIHNQLDDSKTFENKQTNEIVKSNLAEKESTKETVKTDEVLTTKSVGFDKQNQKQMKPSKSDSLNSSDLIQTPTQHNNNSNESEDRFLETQSIDADALDVDLIKNKTDILNIEVISIDNTQKILNNETENETSSSANEVEEELMIMHTSDETKVEYSKSSESVSIVKLRDKDLTNETDIVKQDQATSQHIQSDEKISDMSPINSDFISIDFITISTTQTATKVVENEENIDTSIKTAAESSLATDSTGEESMKKTQIFENMEFKKSENQEIVSSPSMDSLKICKLERQIMEIQTRNESPAETSPNKELNEHASLKETNDEEENCITIDKENSNKIINIDFEKKLDHSQGNILSTEQISDTQALTETNDGTSKSDNVELLNIDESVVKISNNLIPCLGLINDIPKVSNTEKMVKSLLEYVKVNKECNKTRKLSQDTLDSEKSEKHTTKSYTSDNKELEKSHLENDKNNQDSTSREISENQTNHAEQEEVANISNYQQISSASFIIRGNQTDFLASHLNLEMPSVVVQTFINPTTNTGILCVEEKQTVLPNATNIAILSRSKAISNHDCKSLASSNEILNLDLALVVKDTSTGPITFKDNINPVTTKDSAKLTTTTLEISTITSDERELEENVSENVRDSKKAINKDESILKVTDGENQNKSTLQIILSLNSESNEKLQSNQHRDSVSLIHSCHRVNESTVKLNANAETETVADSKQNSNEKNDLKAKTPIGIHDKNSKNTSLFKGQTLLDELTKKSEDILKISSSNDSERITQSVDTERAISKIDSITQVSRLDRNEEMKPKKSLLSLNVSMSSENQQNNRNIERENSTENDDLNGGKVIDQQLPTCTDTNIVLTKEIETKEETDELLRPEIAEHKMRSNFDERENKSSNIAIPPQKEMPKIQSFLKSPTVMEDAYNAPTILPSISTNSPTPSNFSGIFSKKSLQVAGEDDIINQKHKRRLPNLITTKPREYVLLAASVLCNVDNLENATKPIKKLHWELLENKNELTEIEDDTDVDNTDEERIKAKVKEKKQKVLTLGEEPPPRLTPYKCMESLTSDSETQSEDESRNRSLTFLKSATNKQKPLDQRRKTIDTVSITHAVSYYKHLEELEQKKKKENTLKKKAVKKQLTFLTNKVKKTKHSRNKISKNVKAKHTGAGVIRVRKVESLMDDELVKVKAIKGKQSPKIANGSHTKEKPQPVGDLRKSGTIINPEIQQPNQYKTMELEAEIKDVYQNDYEEKRKDNKTPKNDQTNIEVNCENLINSDSNKQSKMIEDYHRNNKKLQLKSKEQQQGEIANKISSNLKVNKSLDDQRIYQEFLSSCSKSIKESTNTITDDHEETSSDNSEIAFSQENIERNKDNFKNCASTSKLNNETETNLNNENQKNIPANIKGIKKQTENQNIKDIKKQSENQMQGSRDLNVENNVKAAINVMQSGGVNVKHFADKADIFEEEIKSGLDVVPALETTKIEAIQDSGNSEKFVQHIITKEQIKTLVIPIKVHDLETTHHTSVIYDKENSIDDHNIAVAENSEPECNKYLQDHELPSISNTTKSPEKYKLQRELSKMNDHKLSVLENHRLQNEKSLGQQELNGNRDVVEESFIYEKDIQQPNEEKSKASQTDNQTQKSTISTKTNSKVTTHVNTTAVMAHNKKKTISLEEIGIKVRPFKGHLSSFRIPKVNKALEGPKDKLWKLETYSEVCKETQNSQQSNAINEQYDKAKYASLNEKLDKTHRQYKVKKPENKNDKEEEGLPLKLKKDESKLSDHNKIKANPTKEKVFCFKENKEEEEMLHYHKEKIAKRQKAINQNCESKINETQHIRCIEDTRENNQETIKQAISHHSNAKGSHCSEKHKQSDIFQKELLKIYKNAKNIPTISKDTKLNEMEDLKMSSYKVENKANKNETDSSEDQRKSFTNKRKLFSSEIYSVEENFDDIESCSDRTNDNFEIKNEQNGKLQETVQNWSNKNSSCSSSKDSQPKCDSDDNICHVTQKTTALRLHRKSKNLRRRILDSSSDEETTKISLKSSQSSQVSNQDSKFLKTFKSRRKSINLHRRILDSSCDEETTMEKKSSIDIKESSSNIKQEEGEIDTNLKLHTPSIEQRGNTKELQKPLKIRRKSMYQEIHTSTGEFVHKKMDHGQADNSLDKTQLDIININRQIIDANPTPPKSQTYFQMCRHLMNQQKVSSNNQQEVIDNQLLKAANSVDKNQLEMLRSNNERNCTNAILNRRNSLYQESVSVNIQEDETKRDNQVPALERSKDKPYHLNLKNCNKEKDETNPLPKKSLKIRRKSMYHQERQNVNNKEEHLELEKNLDKTQLEISNTNNNKEKEETKTSLLKMHRKSMYKKREQVQVDEKNLDEINFNLITNTEKSPVLTKKTKIVTPFNQLDNKSITNLKNTDTRHKSDSNCNTVLDLNKHNNTTESPDNSSIDQTQIRIQNEEATAIKTKSRKRRIVKVLSTSSEEPINYLKNLQIPHNTNQISITPPLISPTLSHPIFTTEVTPQPTDLAIILPPTPNKQYDEKFKEIDSKLHEIFQSPQYMVDYKNPTSHLLDETNVSSIPLNFNDSLSNITIEETIVSNPENYQSSMNTTNHNDSMNNHEYETAHNQSEIKHLLMGSSQYRFEKVSDNVVKLFISRKRKRKRTN